MSRPQIVTSASGRTSDGASSQGGGALRETPDGLAPSNRRNDSGGSPPQGVLGGPTSGSHSRARQTRGSPPGRRPREGERARGSFGRRLGVRQVLTPLTDRRTPPSPRGVLTCSGPRRLSRGAPSSAQSSSSPEGSARCCGAASAMAARRPRPAGLPQIRLLRPPGPALGSAARWVCQDCRPRGGACGGGA